MFPSYCCYSIVWGLYKSTNCLIHASSITKRNKMKFSVSFSFYSQNPNCPRRSCQRHAFTPSCLLLLALAGSAGISGEKEIGEATHCESLLSELYLSMLNSIANNIHKNLAIGHLSFQHHWISERKGEGVLPIVASWNNIFQEKICWKDKQKLSHLYRICCKHKEIFHSGKVESSADLLEDGIWPLPFSSSSLHLLSITFYRHRNRTKTYNTVSSLQFVF